MFDGSLPSFVRHFVQRSVPLCTCASAGYVVKSVQSTKVFNCAIYKIVSRFRLTSIGFDSSCDGANLGQCFCQTVWVSSQ